jgi:hypothetical protein
MVMNATRDELVNLVANIETASNNDLHTLIGHLQTAIFHFDADKPARIAFMIRKFIAKHPDLESNTLVRMLKLVD